MAAGKKVSLLLLVLASTSIYAQSRVPQSTGRKLFGGYRIVPKACKPTIPSRVKSSEPTICMFNYECSRRNGQVVGACMDGFLFGACCQLPPKGTSDYEKTSTEDFFHLEDLDHVPDIPILLNPEDGRPIGVTVPGAGTSVKTETSGDTNQLSPETIYTRLSTLSPSSTFVKPTSTPSYNHDSVHNAERPQVPMQPDISHLEEDFPVLLGQHHILDELGLPGLLSHSDSNNDIQDHQDNTVVNPVTTLLSPDQVLQIADPVDQLPALFSQGLGQSNHTSADTILLNENGTVLDETNNPDDLFKPSGETSVYATEKSSASEELESTTKMTRETVSVVQEDEKQDDKKETMQDTDSGSGSTAQWVRFPEQTSPTQETMSSYGERTQTTSGMMKLPMVTQMYDNSQRVTSAAGSSEYTMPSNLEKASTIQERVSTKDIDAFASGERETTTPMTGSGEKKEELVRVPTITYNTPSGNKKNDVEDKEEMAINHIISILNDTTPNADKAATVQGPSSSIHTWVSIDETAKPSSLKTSTTRAPGSTATTSNTFPYTFYRPSTYYNYETIPTETSHSSFSTADSYSQRPPTQTTHDGSSSFGYSGRPTTNPPAPTVIVLGPLGTEFTTETTTKSVTRRPGAENSGRPGLITARPTPGPGRPGSVSTKRPSVSTTITHNISTVISNVATNNNRVVSTSVITVNLKDGGTSSAKPTVTTVSTESIVPDNSLEERVTTTRKPAIWTTLSSWPDKPSFYLKPSTPSFTWQESQTPVNTVVFKEPSESPTNLKHTTSNPCDEETAAPDDLINFPPVRNPNLNISAPTSQQEKPMINEAFNHTRYPEIEIISENDIPTPTFIEDDVLTNKVDTFVNKIVESLQSNFQDLKEVVYSRPNATTTTTAVPTVTRRPTVAPSSTKKPTRRPTSTPKPASATTRRPTTTKRPGSRPSPARPSASTERPRPRPTTSRPRPSTSSAVTTKKPSVTTRRPKPTRKPTTTQAPSTEAVVEEETTSVTLSVETSTAINDQTPAPGDFRQQCGIRPLVRTGKIVGGKAAEFGEWPWQVLVREATWLGLFTKNKCGGVLITDKYVLTAAHCQPGFLAALVAVFGEFDLSGELEEKRSVTRNVRNVIVNRAYNPTTFENDLALLELESPVQFDEHIVPICMPDDGIDFTGRMATVTGWGRLKYNGGVPSVLQEVQVPIMENSVCQEMFLTAGYSKLILESFLCAGYANGQKDSCEGDSGGPLVMKRPDGRWFLVGTVSHGIKCASPYLPGVYMRTTHFKPWLSKVTGMV